MTVRVPAEQVEVGAVVVIGGARAQVVEVGDKDYESFYAILRFEKDNEFVTMDFATTEMVEVR